MSRFTDLFPRKPIIGMLHLGGVNPVNQAMEDYEIYVQEGLDGVIVENYHGSVEDVEKTLAAINKQEKNIRVGINVLGDFRASFELAGDYGAGFIQIDSVQPPDINLKFYDRYRALYLNTVVLGGIGFKGATDPGDNLEAWLKFGRERADAIVTTGPGTGKETPIKKLEQYKSRLGEFPLIEGAGSTAYNVGEHLRVADGVIVGSFYKANGDTQLPVERLNVRRYVIEANKAR